MLPRRLGRRKRKGREETQPGQWPQLIQGTFQTMSHHAQCIKWGGKGDIWNDGVCLPKPLLLIMGSCPPGNGWTLAWPLETSELMPCFALLPSVFFSFPMKLFISQSMLSPFQFSPLPAGGEVSEWLHGAWLMAGLWKVWNQKISNFPCNPNHSGAVIPQWQKQLEWFGTKGFSQSWPGLSSTVAGLNKMLQGQDWSGSVLSVHNHFKIKKLKKKIKLIIMQDSLINSGLTYWKSWWTLD